MQSRQWWKESVVYQIYPRSFYDTNGDGIGDLKGITAKLDYLKDLGVDVLWLSPVYQSPNDDNGYDISDYKAIMNEFGTLDDFDEMLAGIHERGMRLVMDLVVNHTSDEHPWFVESRSSKETPYRDYYIWRPSKDGEEPNNWESIFSGSAWQYDERTEEYYLHLFSKKQPDLNWENSKVRQEIYEMMTWWLDKGIDGFRMDVVNGLSKPAGLSDAPNAAGKQYVLDLNHYFDGPRIHEFLQEMYDKVLSKYDIMTVGETAGVTPESAALYAGEDRRELNMVFQFEHMGIDHGVGGKWDAKPWRLQDLKNIMSRWQDKLYGVAWNSNYLNNHDQPRAVSRFGDDRNYRVESAKMLVTMIHFLQGTPFVYQGEEIGMTNVHFDHIEDYQDVEIHNLWSERVVHGGEDADKLFRAIQTQGRDNARTPMQWDDTPHAGFTTGTPWIQVNPNYPWINVQQSLSHPNSILNYYKRVIAFRKRNDTVVYGKYQLLLADHDEIYAFTRSHGNDTLLVILNFFGNRPVFELPEFYHSLRSEFILGNYPDGHKRSGMPLRLELQPYEAIVFNLT
jgi:oligo-1,6-glucosidase